MKLQLDVIKECSNWSVLKKDISKIIKVVIEHFPMFADAEVEIAVLLTDDDHMQKLNLEFLGKDKPTNVLSFPDSKISTHDLLEFSPKREYIYIGDLALGYSIIEREANELNISFSEHFAHLIVHGVLHLIGFDHEVEDEAEEMMELEVILLKLLGIKSPY